MRKLGVIVLAALALAAACSNGDRGALDAARVRARASLPPGLPPELVPPRANRTVAAASTGLTRLDSCNELLGYLRTNAARVVGPYGLGHLGAGPIAVDAVAAPMRRQAGAEAMAADQSAAPGGGAGAGYSTTNVQEEGVDEPDIVKTDGRRLFVLAGDTIRALDLTPGGPRPAGSLKLKGWAQNMLLAGERLLVIGEGGDIAGRGAEESLVHSGSGGARIDVVDVSDASSMSIVSTLTLEGSVTSARLVDGVARVVLTTHGPAIEFAYPQEPASGGPRSELEATARNRQLVTNAAVDQWVPNFRLEGPGGQASEGRVSDCDATYHPSGFSGFGMVSVLTLNPLNPEPGASATVVGAGQNVYASTSSLYVSSTVFPDNPGPLPVDVAASEIETTQIHRFDITNPERAVYRSSGSVRGWLLNQFSMSEHAGHLRVAATEGRFGESTSSAVNVLAERGDRLETVGRVEGLGRGETIHSVRFLGDVGYVVTFRRIDPLYTVDLSNPAEPRVVGELKIPGYSAYLHPIGDGMLLGVGQDATEEGQATGTQVSLFDVRDPANPKRVHQVKISQSSSEAEWDHHAFLWWGPRRMAVLPVNEWREDGSATLEAVALRVGDADIAELTRISHTPSEDVENQPVPMMIRRAVVWDDQLLTVSDGGVMSNALDGFARRGWVAFG